MIDDRSGFFHLHKDLVVEVTQSGFADGIGRHGVDCCLQVGAGIEKICVEMADALGVPVISSMGAGNKLDPTAFEVADINKTSVCPLAKVMRQELRKRGIKKLKVVYSKEPALGVHEDASQECIHECFGDTADSSRPMRSPGSNAFVPSVAGLILASEVIKDLVK